MTANTLRTCTTMVLTDGTTSYYAVMVGPVSKRGQVFHSGDAEMVATYKLVNEKPNYRAMTARHATAEAPAIAWQM